MEQANRASAHIERILLICGAQNAGKSRLLRQMLSDLRLAGEAPTSNRVAPLALSRERLLVVRCTSPHEYNESVAEFHDKIADAAERAWNEGYWRMNYACAMQPDAFNKMPAINDVCAGLAKQFAPERIRVVQLMPDKEGNEDSRLCLSAVDDLRLLEDVELLSIDARKRQGVDAEPGNIRILADYFDFS